MIETQTHTEHADNLSNVLFQAMSGHRSGVFELVGTSPRSVLSRVAKLTVKLRGESIETFVVSDDHPDFHSLVLSATTKAHEAGLLDDDLLDLADRAAREPDVRFRYWMEIVSRLRHVLIVTADLEKAPWVRQLAQRCYSDPIAEIDPEFASNENLGAMFIASGGLDAKQIDCSVASREDVRKTLQTDAVLDRLVASTGGDIDAVETLITQLGSHEHDLNYVRYQARNDIEKHLIQLLSLAGGITPSILRASCDMERGEFPTVLRTLTDDNLIERVINRGEVRVKIADERLAALISARLGDDAQPLHRLLAEAEIENDIQTPDDVFISKHFFEANDARGVEYAQRAIPQLVTRGELDKVLWRLSKIREFGDDDVASVAMQQTIDVFERGGRFREAITSCEQYIEAYGSDVEIELIRGRLLSRVGRLNDSEQTLRAIKTKSKDVMFDVQLALVDVLHGLGRHDEVETIVESVLKNVGNAKLDERRQDEIRIRAKNALARVDFFRRDFVDAERRWEENRELAVRWGWDNEIARAEANLGVAAMSQERNAEAKRRLERALELTDIQHVVPRSHCLVNLAILSQRERNFSDALKFGLDAMRVAKRSGDTNGFSIAARNLATVYMIVGAFDRADRMMTYLRDTYEFDATTLNGSWNVLVDAELSFDRQAYDEAIEKLDTLVHGPMQKIFASRAGLRAGYAALKSGDVDRAKQAIDSYEEATPELDALARLVEAELLALSDSRAALPVAEEAFTLCQQHGKVADSVRARGLIARVQRDLGRTDDAIATLRLELQTAFEIARQIPESIRDAFFRKPEYLQLVELLRDLEGDVPEEFEVTSTHVAIDTNRSRYNRFVGEDQELYRIFRIIDKVAVSDTTVLIYGESGTGKELVAESLHRESERRHKPFVKVNCAALVEDLLLSELFGHEKGAFTGAVGQKIGRFELADGGTIFLDEIGDISPNTQVALLRVLQEGTFERVGGSETQTVDVRVVCATNRNLEELVARGTFRLDLYYRLKGVVIETPPLRSRRDDIGRLAQHFAANPGSGEPKTIAPAAVQELARYSWPGNIRELQNFIRSVVLFVDGDSIERRHVEEFRDFFVSGTMDPMLAPVDVDYLHEPTGLEESTEPDMPTSVTTESELEEALVERIIRKGESLSDMKKKLEIECIKRALIETGGNVTKAAEILQMKRPRLSQIIGEHEELSELKSQLVA